MRLQGPDPTWDSARHARSLLPCPVLHPPRQSAVVRARNGKVTIDAGPFAVAKTQVGGFFIIEARDLNEAIRVAAMHPAGQLNEHLGWAVEVRPIEVFESMTVYASATA